MEDKFIALGRNRYMYYVHNGYAATLSEDGTAVTWTVADVKDGVYDQDGPVDEELASLYWNKLNRPVLFMTKQTTIREMIEGVLNKIIKHHDVFEPIVELPKLNKAIAEGLDKILETVSFAQREGDVKYVCIGARQEVTQFYDKVCFVSPTKLYWATQFKGDKYGRITPYGIIVSDAELKYITLILTIEIEKRLEAINGLSTSQEFES